MWILFSSYNLFIDILFPKCCLVCKKKNSVVCKTCLANFSRAVITPHSFIYSHFSYKNKNIKSIIRSIKYYHRKDLIEPIIIATIPEVQNIIFKENNCLLIPIPMHPFRKMIRGYNQAEIIAEEYSQLLNVPLSTKILYRTKLTTRQVMSKNKNERIKNQNGSFTIKTSAKNFNEIKNKTIILIDDVTTTGATLNEARNIFLKNDFKNVLAITLAH